MKEIQFICKGMTYLLIVWLSFSAALAETVRYHRGDLILRGNQQLTLENETLYVKGNVVLKDSAKLILRNATLRIKQTYHEEYQADLYDRATLLLENAVIDSTFDIIIISLHDRSRLIANNSQIKHEIVLLDSGQVEITRSTVDGFVAEEDGYKFRSVGGIAQATLRNSFIHEITLGIAQYCKLKAQDLRPGDHVTFYLGPEQAQVGSIPYEIQVENCGIVRLNFVVGKRANVEFQDCKIFKLACYDSAKVLVINSEIYQVVLRLQKLYVAFGGLKTGGFKDWTLSSTKGWLPCSLRFVDSKIIEGWYLRLRGGNYHISDSVIVRLRDEFDSSRDRYHLENCCIQEWQPWWDYGTVILENCILGTIHAPDGATPTLRGNFCVLNPEISEFWGPWRNNSVITRYFSIIVRDTDGTPLSGVAFELIDPDGNVVQRGTTGPQGEAEVKIRFTKDNFEKQWTLRIPQLNKSQPITITSSTPIMFPPNPQPCPELPCREALQAGSGVPDSEAQRCLCSGRLTISWDLEKLVSTSSQHRAEDPNRDIIALYAWDDGENLYIRLEFRGKEPDSTGTTSRYELYLSSPDWKNIGYKFVADQGTIEKNTLPGWQKVESQPVDCCISDAVEVAVPLSILPPFTELRILGQSRIFPDKVVDTIIGTYIKR